MNVATFSHRTTAATTPAATTSGSANITERVRETLARVRREPEGTPGWIMRRQRTSPLETRYVAR